MNIVNRPAAQLGVHDAEIMKDQLILYTARKLLKKGMKTKGLMLLGQTRALGELPISNYKTAYQYIEEIATPGSMIRYWPLLIKRTKRLSKKCWQSHL